jgi:hypothetical protein
MPSGVRWYVILVVVLTIVATVAAMLEDDWAERRARRIGK